MFDIGFWEIAVIAAIMLVVLGPERLPGVARTAGFWLSKMRRMVSDVKSEVKREMDAAELKELEDAKNQIQEASKTVHKQINEASSSVQKQMNKDIVDDNELSAESTNSSDNIDNKNATNSVASDQVAQEHSAEKSNT